MATTGFAAALAEVEAECQALVDSETAAGLAILAPVEKFRDQVWEPTTRTMFRQYGPNHLGL